MRKETVLNDTKLLEILDGMLGILKSGVYVEDVSGKIAIVESMVESMDIDDGGHDEKPSVEQDGRMLVVNGVEQAGIVVQSGKTIILNSCEA